MPSEWELAGRVVLALVLGGLVGLEREVSGHPAGIRTHITVALGAALFTIVGAYGFEDLGLRRTSVDRIASTVVTGIGFLGGGAILKEGATVKGLTTAGSLWVTAAIGVGLGAGAYVVTLVTFVAVLFSLVALRGPRRWIVRRLAKVRETVVVTLERGADPSPVLARLSNLAGTEVKSLVVREQGETVVIHAEVKAAPGIDVDERLAELVGRDGVTGVQVG